MTETTIFGPPGTGKTTRLIKIVEGHLLQKKDPKKFIPGLLALPGEITIFGKKPFAKENPFLNIKPDVF